MKLRSRGKLLTVIMMALVASPVVADEIVLTSADHSVVIRGQFVAFEDGKYVVDLTTGGTVRVAAGRINCEGNDCLPEAETLTARPADLLSLLG